jgi:hypothetical protein
MPATIITGTKANCIIARIPINFQRDLLFLKAASRSESAPVLR